MLELLLLFFKAALDWFYVFLEKKLDTYDVLIHLKSARKTVNATFKLKIPLTEHIEELFFKVQNAFSQVLVLKINKNKNTYNQVEYIRRQSFTIKNQSNIIMGVHNVVNVS